MNKNVLRKNLIPKTMSISVLECSTHNNGILEKLLNKNIRFTFQKDHDIILYRTKFLNQMTKGVDTGTGWTGYFYNLKLKENGELDIQSRRPLSDSLRHSIYSIENNDLLEIKPYLVDLLNSD